MVISFDLLHEVNEIIIFLQKKEMHIDVAIQLEFFFVAYLQKYRKFGFVSAEIMANEMEIECASNYLKYDTKLVIRK